jgi:tRNA A37 threonylcarbamoyladenosine biosynthesis protein TsaE
MNEMNETNEFHKKMFIEHPEVIKYISDIFDKEYKEEDSPSYVIFNEFKKERINKMILNLYDVMDEYLNELGRSWHLKQFKGIHRIEFEFTLMNHVHCFQADIPVELENIFMYNDF